MSLNSVSGKAFLEKINTSYNQNQKSKQSAYNSFAGNLKEKAEQEIEESSKKRKTDSLTTAQVDYRSGKVATELLIQKSGRVEMNAVVEVSTRHISYSESDHVKVCVAEGYTLKAQVEATEHRVYIEQKNENGTYQAYEVNPLEVSEDTQNPIEQMALEAWEMARDLFNDGMFTEIDDIAAGGEKPADANEATAEENITFEEMVDQFREFVEKRIKEGPPKIQIGGAEYTEEEWKRLLKRIDKDIDAYKEELRERIKKQQEQDALKRITGSAAEELETTETVNTRGSSFLARLSGEKKAPYSYLADENGMIIYKGVTFVCDDKKQQICLGDVSNPKDVLTIPLAKGGCLKVNRDNLGDLATAISMFSPEDVGRIMRAIAQDTKTKEMQFEIDEMTI